MTVQYTDLGRRYAKAFPDEAECRAWAFAFGASLDTAKVYRQHFGPDEADTAAAWERTTVSAEIAGYLHRHHVPPRQSLISQTLLLAREEQVLDAPRSIYEQNTRLAVRLAHPHLTRADRDAIVRARLDLSEVDHLVETATFDRDSLALLGGLR